ncbi:MAG: hypothetical protein ACP5L4_04675 [Thermoplasmata archaeon]
MPDRCQKLLFVWNKGNLYYSEIFFRIIMLILFFSISIDIIIYYSMIFKIIGIILILIVSLILFIPVKDKKGLKSSKAKLYERCYFSYASAFDIIPIKVYFDDLDEIIFIKLKNFNLHGRETVLEFNTQGWQTIFVKKNREIIWGPEFSIDLSQQDLNFICILYNQVKINGIKFRIVKIEYKEIYNLIENIGKNNMDEIIKNLEEENISFCK